jgi:hypothetical protein
MKELKQAPDGKWYNEYGSLVFPRHKDRPNPDIDTLLPFKKYEKHCYQEFEIQAVTYCKLRDYIGDTYIKGEFSLGAIGGKKYCRADVVILNPKTLEVIVIIEVKRNKQEIIKSKGQINQYYKFCKNVIVISSMKEAENIISQIKGFLPYLPIENK